MNSTYTQRKDLKPVILLKTGELFLKGENRFIFIERLASNIRKISERDFPEIEIEEGVGRFLISGYGHDPVLIERLKRVFGIVLVEEVFRCNPALEEIESASIEVMNRVRGAASFKVDCRRTWKKFPLTSMETAARIGEKLVNHYGFKVNLESPSVTLKITIEQKNVFLSVTSHRGAGGLPVGTSGRGVLLLSGGIDSPVAGYLAMKRGLEISCMHFYSPPYTGEQVLRKVDALVEVLRRFNPDIKLYIAQITSAQDFIRKVAKPRKRVILLRWLMMKVASLFASRKNFSALVTGENLGQVASQTLENIFSVEKASKLPVIRPLIAFDKSEIMDIAKRIGSFEISIIPAEDCCTLFIPRYPTTKVRLEDCLEYDAIFAEKGIYDECLANVTERE